MSADMREEKRVYRQSLDYAKENGEIDLWRESLKENVTCKEAIEDAIRKNFDGMYLKRGIVAPLLSQFGAERLCLVLSATIRMKEWDGRFSERNKEWARRFTIHEDKDSFGRNHISQYEVESHPAILDGFVEMVRQEIVQRDMREKEVNSVPEGSGRPVDMLESLKQALMKPGRIAAEEGLQLLQKIHEEAEASGNTELSAYILEQRNLYSAYKVSLKKLLREVICRMEVDQKEQPGENNPGIYRNNRKNNEDIGL